MAEIAPTLILYNALYSRYLSADVETGEVGRCLDRLRGEWCTLHKPNTKGYHMGPLRWLYCLRADGDSTETARAAKYGCLHASVSVRSGRSVLCDVLGMWRYCKTHLSKVPRCQSLGHGLWERLWLWTIGD